jgi:hypothetical protein
MSFQISLAPNRRAAARFIGKVRRRLQRALIENPEVKRTQIANALGVHRSVITRQLKGAQDMSLGRVAEIAWSLGYEPSFELVRVSIKPGDNHETAPIPAILITPNIRTVSTSSNSTFVAKNRGMELS